MTPLKVGILGTGQIARKMALTLGQMDLACAYAVASRDRDKALHFAAQCGVEKAHDSYEALVADPQVDLVYVCSPHPFHYQNARLALEQGKPVLCEKPFAMNYRQGKALIDLAAQKGVFITEAVWTRFLPLAKTLCQQAHSGIIGNIVSVQAGFGFNARSTPRMTDPALGGGALLDLGVYPLQLAYMVLGEPLSLGGQDAVLWETGVDAANQFTLHYPGLQTAHCASSMVHKMTDTWYVYGDTGRIEVQGISNLEHLRLLNDAGQELAFIPAPAMISGYEYEVLACREALRQGALECTEMPHAHTLSILQYTDRLLSLWGVPYPEFPL